MASYQDIDIRLKVAEDMLSFIMDSMHMKAAVSSGMLGPDGIPLPSKVFAGSLKELYYLSRQLPVLDEQSAPPPPIETL